MPQKGFVVKEKDLAVGVVVAADLGLAQVAQQAQVADILEQVVAEAVAA